MVCESKLVPRVVNLRNTDEQPETVVAHDRSSMKFTPDTVEGSCVISYGL